MYRIFETENFQKCMKSDFGGRREKIKKKLQGYVYPQLKASPMIGKNIKKLRNWEPPTWRYRIGPYRFFYEIHMEERIVFMIAAEHRGGAY